MPRPNRRLGERRPVQSSELQWNVPKQTALSRFKKQQPEVGLLQDVSVTGAGVVAPISDQIQRGSKVAVAFGWVQGSVRVMRVEPHPDGVRAVYGVEWESTDSELARAILHNFLQSDLPPY
ncbi:MAG: PilZ domain-containing protein [Acidimicrobiales bacterium]|nr:PilZ domain-containing protein [Acidimicrobiales bacterium]